MNDDFDFEPTGDGPFTMASEPPTSAHDGSAPVVRMTLDVFRLTSNDSEARN